MTRTNRPWTALARRLGVDARALAALRVAVGALLLADLAIRATDLVAHYTDAGVLPRAALATQYPTLSRLSLHALSGAAWVQAALFLAAVVAAVALVVGYRTRLATAASLVLLVSLHLRNPLLLNAGDALLRRLLLWSLFLPLGRRWSLDALRGDHPTSGSRSHSRVASVASAALLLQVVVIYAINAAFKLRGDLWLRGDAIQYVFSLDHLTVRLGDLLAGYPALLEAFDWLWLALVSASVLLVVLTGRARAAFAGLLAAMHLGMALTMRLGVFPLVSVAALLPFLPSSVWDAVEAHTATWRARIFDAPPVRALRRAPPAGSIASHAPTLPGWTRRVPSVVAAVLLAVVLGFNAASLGYVAAPDAVADTVDERGWTMFAPEPRGVDGWYVVVGHLDDGGQVDAFHDSPVRWEPPPDAADTYPSHRWFLYLLDLRAPANADLRPQFADYVCREWSDRHDRRLSGVTIYYVEQPTRLDGPEPTRRVEMGRYSCPGA
jgi:hypothetical protein